MNQDEPIFQEEEIQKKTSKETWKILIVDDDAQEHTFTRLALRDFTFENKKLTFISSYSAKEAQKIIQQNDDIALILLDIVMETSTAGLDLIEIIRKKFKNSLIRIILRTEQAEIVLERYIIEHYDINDYKEKKELTSDKLYTTIRTSLSQYKHLLELHNKKNEIYNAFTTDSLTGLGNRNKLKRDLDTHEPKSLVLINIDSFSIINDAYGFKVGDQLLKQFKGYLVSNVDPKWDAYYLEAGTFSLLLNCDYKDDVYTEFEKIKCKITQHTFIIYDMNYHINVTVGIVEKEIGNIIQKAEFALHEARQLGRNRIQMYSENLNIIKQIQENAKWSKLLKEALNKGNIIAYFQPIVECKTNKIVKYEALVRLEKDDTVYSPFYFLPTARYAGLLNEITKTIFIQTCTVFSNNNLNFSINITDQDLYANDFIDFLEDTRKKYNIDIDRISLEILEDNNLLHSIATKEQLKKLIDKGYKLSIDDFGVKCSNFAQVSSLPLDSIKIDGSFIKNIDKNLASQRVTDTILYFTKKINVKTVAEFVHNEKIYNIIKSMGIDYAQGYFFGEPKPYLIEE